MIFSGETAAAHNSLEQKQMRNVLPPSARIVLCGSWKRGRVEKTQQAAL